ncbi:MAG: hypothetical protein IT559_06800 [Alphaproteobacteria bacterium]|nr:hypothetical protein [Alphaproteobacteria bacterium]
MALAPEIVEIVNQRLFEPFNGFCITDDLHRTARGLRDAKSHLKKTDVGVIFGGRSTSGKVASLASTLQMNGAYERHVVAGGARIFQPEVALALVMDRNPEILKSQTIKDIFSLATEADYMKEVLERRGTWGNQITIGSRACHTHEIVQDVMKLDFESATIVGYAPYMARLIGTFRRYGENRPLVPCPVGVFGLTPENWHKSKLAGHVVKEARNMDPKNPKGNVGKFCVVPDWEEERRKNETLAPINP